MQDLIIYNEKKVIIQANNIIYQDTKENFLIDYGKLIEYTSIDYNRDTESCWLNNQPFQKFPNDLCEDILNNIDSLLINKEQREYIELTLNELKNIKVFEMKNERDRIQELPIEYNGKIFDYNKESLQKLNEAKDCLEGTEDKQIWICADNSLTYLTYDDIMSIKRLGKDRSNEVHIQYAKLKYIIEQLETKEEVEAITFDTDTSNIQLEV